MKILWTAIFVTMFLWSSPVAAEYCTVSPGTDVNSCIFETGRMPNNTQVIISYTKQGWALMIAVFFSEFAMIEGDAKVKIGKGELQNMKFVSTRRDMVANGLLMEAALYKVTEAQLHELGYARGKIRFWLAASEAKNGEVEVKVKSSHFNDIEAYIAETKTALGALFKDE